MTVRRSVSRSVERRRLRRLATRVAAKDGLSPGITPLPYHVDYWEANIVRDALTRHLNWETVRRLDAQQRP